MVFVCFDLCSALQPAELDSSPFLKPPWATAVEMRGCVSSARKLPRPAQEVKRDDKKIKIRIERGGVPPPPQCESILSQKMDAFYCKNRVFRAKEKLEKSTFSLSSSTTTTRAGWPNQATRVSARRSDGGNAAAVHEAIMKQKLICLVKKLS